eukprot:14686301-Alexandrium_andersonii.AAC.1
MVATAAPAAALLLPSRSPPLGFDRSSCYECYCGPTQLGCRCRARHSSVSTAALLRMGSTAAPAA